jgi:amidase
MPAERNNVIGFKPTRGFIGTEATIPISNRQDVIGTLTRTVMDAAYLLNQMVGRSERDERTWNIPVDPIPDFTQFCQGVDLSGLRLGIPRNAFADNMPAAIMDAFSMASRTFTSAGAAVIDDANFTAADEFRKLNQQVKGIVRSSEFKRDIVKYLDCLTANPNEIKSVEDIINFTKSNDAELYPEKDIGKFLWTQAEGVEVDSDKYKHMLEQEAYFGGEGGILGALEKYKLDALILPSTNGIAGDLAAKMGFPILVVPLGFWPAGTEIQKGESGLTEVAPGMP